MQRQVGDDGTLSEGRDGRNVGGVNVGEFNCKINNMQLSGIA